MPTARKLLAGLALALTAISCSDDKGPTAPAVPNDQPLSAPTAPKPQSKALLTDRVVTGTLADGRTITGTVTVTKFNHSQAGGLTVDGVLNYTVVETGETDTQTFFGATATLKRGIGAPTQPTCEILDLDIGAIHLDLLGLVVDLAPIHLDIVAESGSGNLLGNLLCALAGLLNGPNLGGLLGAIQDLLEQINAILMGL
jgi:hypothetical protein